MPPTQVILHLTSTYVEAATMLSNRCASRRIVRFATVDNRPFAEQLQTIGPAVDEVLSNLSPRTTRVTIVTALTGMFSGVFAVPGATSVNESSTAALLALAELSQFSPADHPHATHVVATDSGPEARRYVLAATMKDDVAAATADLVLSRGFQLSGIYSLEALKLASVVAALQREAGTEPTGILWIGESESVLACRVGQSLKLVRTLAVGLDHLLSALARPIRGGGGDVTYTPAEAYAALIAGGIPAPGTSFDASRDVDATAVLPLMQPMLQRLAIEIKQSLRFSLTEEQRGALTLHIDGSGALVARLGDLVARQIGVNAVIAPTCGQSVGSHETGDAAIRPWSVIERLPMVLLPERIAEQREQKRVAVAMWAGVAAAAMFVTFSGFSAASALRSERASLAAIVTEGSGQGNAMPRAKAEQVTASSQLVDATRARIDGMLATRADLGAVLRSIASSAPEGFRFTRLEIIEDERGCIANVVGRSDLTDELAFAGRLRTFTGTVTQNPLVRSVTLGATGRITASGSEVPGHRFELKVQLLSLPRETGVQQTRVDAGGSQ